MKKFLWLKKSCIINDFNGEEIIETFYKKELQKTNQNEFIIEKVIKRKGNKLYVKWKQFHLMARLMKIHCIKISKSFSKPYKRFEGNIKVTVDLFNYATKADIKNISHVNKSRFELKSNLASLKTVIQKLDIKKLAPVPVALSKLRDAVKDDVVEKTVYDQLVAEVDNADASGLVLKTKYDTD